MILEVRNGDNDDLETLRDALNARGLEYEVRFTPRRRELQRIRMIWKDEGVLILSAVAGAIAAMFEAARLDISEGIIVSENGFAPSTNAADDAS